MAIEAKAGGSIRVTVKKNVTRAAAMKTLERLFMTDSKASAEVDARTANFEAKPKRRGGRIWTKRPNKVHLDLKPGTTATVKATPQHVKDLRSVEEFVDVVAA